jgi:ANTAR domain-containing protein
MDEKLPRVGVLSRMTVNWAIEKLQRQHGLTDPGTGFAALQKASQMHNVKLRSVAAALVAAGESTVNRRHRRSGPPPLSFSERGAAAQPNRTHVLHDLLHHVTGLTGADHGVVQLRDPVHGGLVIECHTGFGRHFLDRFSYVDNAGTASGTTLACGSQTFVDDVETSTIYAFEDRQVVLTEGVRSVFSTALRHRSEGVYGAVTVTSAAPHRIPSALVAEQVQQRADECARWLRWYDNTAMPRVLAAVHTAASAAKLVETASAPRLRPVPSPSALRAASMPPKA